MVDVSRTPLRVTLVLVTTLAAALTTSRPTQAALIRIGLAQGAPAGAAVAGRLPARARIRVTFALEPRRPRALAAYARAVSVSGSPSWHHYLSPVQFGRRFGAGPAQISLVRRTLTARGLRPGPTSPGRLSIPVAATAGALDHALSISLVKLSLPGRRTAVVANAPPALAARTARLIQSVVGLDSSASPRPLLVRPAFGEPPATAQPSSRPPATGGPQPCASARAQAVSRSGYTADRIATAYGFAGLYTAGDDGAGVTVAGYELEPDDPSDIAAYEACYAANTSISYVPVDGGVGPGPGSGEAALDIENLIGLAPGARLLVYQGPNSNSGAPGSGPYDTFSAIINQDRARVVSVSWGQCEAALGAGNAAAENTLFMQAAVEGQSIVAAAGDSGSEDCETSPTATDAQLAVDDPASQPYVIGVGGTTLSTIGPPPTESVWNGGATISGGPPAPGAGGGGFSSLWPMSFSQLNATSSLNVLGAGVTGARCDQPSGYCREVPDVSADADPSTGYLIYWNGNHGQIGQPAGWQPVGGTSAAVPVWAALLTLADASSACDGSPLGFPGPVLYHAAGEDYATDFHDVRSGENDFTHGNDGQFAAGVGYDEASGLGTPNATPLAARLCAGTVRVANPGGQRSTVHAAVSLHLHSGGSPGGPISLTVNGLPPGLSLNPATGEISGRPQRTGQFDVSVTAQNRFGASARAVFGWSVGSAPQVPRLAVAGVGIGQPRLTFTLTAGREAPPVARVRITLPRGLRLLSALDVRVQARTTPRPRFTAHLAHGALEIALPRPLGELRLTLAYPELLVDDRRPVPARHRGRGGGGGSDLDLRIVDADAGTSVVRVSLAGRA